VSIKNGASELISEPPANVKVSVTTVLPKFALP